MNKKLQTANGGNILILCDGVKTDEIDLMGLKPENILRVEYYAQMPTRYANLGVDAVLNVITRRMRGGYVMAHIENGFTTGYGTNILQSKYNEDDNDFTLRYFIDYRRLSKYKLEQSYDYILSRNLPVEEVVSNTGLKTNYLYPHLDVYFSKTFKREQELIVDVVNTYYNSESERRLLQTGGGENYEAFTQLNNKSYSLISKVMYSKGLDADRLKKYFVLKPNLTLSYIPSKHASFKFRSTIRSYVPDISLLTDNPVYLDSAFISRGNPLLKPYYDFSNRLLYTVTWPSFYMEAAAKYRYIHRPYYPVFKDKESFIEKTYDNVDKMTEVGGEFYISWSPLPCLSLAPYYEFDYQRATVGGLERNYWHPVFDLRVSTFYKDFTLTGILIVRNKSLAGEMYTKEKNYYSLDLTWKKKNLSITGGLLFLNAPVVSETVKGLPIYYRESKIAGDFNGLVYLQLVYTLPFGKKIPRSMKQQINNTDNDSGIYIENRATL